MKRWSTSYVIREMQIKTTTRHHYTSTIEELKSKTLTTAHADKDVEQQELSLIAGGNVQWCSHSGGSLQN